MQHESKSASMLNITDVLAQVYKKIDKAKNPEALINRMVNYIYIEGFSRMHLSKNEENDLIELGNISKRAGFNGVYRGNTTDKSQFYGIFEKMPIRQ
ncbi:hypothetical protein IV63_GL001261 [Companilactobacillus crustorum]|uniref:Bacteriocin immunity protein n=4 Tax=Companilactobacillus TaxID=2767879 RepID=A0A837RFU3_9LACO|nr:putative leucocin-A immunity protein [Companilactobacillus crustorum]KRK41863.1 hypothetical protein FD26_GL001024 [Companilactobacillus crustorum JCM 15951]KRO19662.1 hypothetical protein IV63_GL001261 [Companilactobacillus crustorum]